MNETVNYKELVKQLTEHGVRFESGLSEEELAAVEEALGTKLPGDYREFLSKGLPVSVENDTRVFPQWRDNLASEMEESKKQLASMLLFDIENNDFWHSSFGEKPSDTKQAYEQALKVVENAPRLVRIHAHSYLPTDPSISGNPILSVWQMGDSVYVASDLVDYFERQFGIKDTPIDYEKIKPVLFWSDVFDLV